MGRSAKELTSDEIAQVEALAAFFTVDRIADYLGIGRRTLYNIFERNPEIDARYKKGRAKAINSVATGVLQRAIEGDNQCAFFYLKTQAGWRETQVIQQETKEVKSFSDMYGDTEPES